MHIFNTDLARIAHQANREHHEVIASIGRGLEHARPAGEHLNQAKKAVPHGDWGAWLRAHFEGSDRTARNYMKIAANWDRLDADENGNAVADLPIREAIRNLAKPRRFPRFSISEIAEPETRTITVISHTIEPEPQIVTVISHTIEPEPQIVTVISHTVEPEPQQAALPVDSAALEHAITRQQVEALKAAWLSATLPARREFERWLARQNRPGGSLAMLKLVAPPHGDN